MSSHPKTPPTLPTVVVDEAGDTPNWVPALGVGLFALVALLIAVQLAWGGSKDSAPAPQPPAAVAEAPAQ